MGKPPKKNGRFQIVLQVGRRDARDLLDTHSRWDSKKTIEQTTAYILYRY